MSAPLPSVLVTGATAFVGHAPSAIASVAVVASAVRRESAALAAFTPAVRIVPVGDIGPNTDWKEALTRVDMVVHLAARAHVMRESASDPLADYRHINVAGSERLARAAAAAGVTRRQVDQSEWRSAVRSQRSESHARSQASPR